MLIYNKINRFVLPGTFPYGGRLAPPHSRATGARAQRLPSLTAADTLLLQQGLATLEAALEAAEQPVPKRLGRLRKQLRRWPLDRGGSSWTESDLMSSREVAERLGVSLQQVHQLGKKGALEIAHAGHPGRNGNTLYRTESVRRYSEHRPSPGRKPKPQIREEAGKEEN